MNIAIGGIIGIAVMVFVVVISLFTISDCHYCIVNSEIKMHQEVEQTQDEINRLSAQLIATTDRVNLLTCVVYHDKKMKIPKLLDSTITFDYE